MDSTIITFGNNAPPIVNPTKLASLHGVLNDVTVVTSNKEILAHILNFPWQGTFKRIDMMSMGTCVNVFSIFFPV